MTSNNVFINFLTSYPGLRLPLLGQILFPDVKSIVTFSLSKLSGAFTEKPPPWYDMDPMATITYKKQCLFTYLFTFSLTEFVYYTTTYLTRSSHWNWGIRIIQRHYWSFEINHGQSQIFCWTHECHMIFEVMLKENNK